MTKLDDAAIAAGLATLVDWSRDGDTLVRTVRRRDFRDAMALLVAIGDEAERANHHPDLCLWRYRTIEVRLTTHAEGGISERDLSLAATIEALIGA